MLVKTGIPNIYLNKLTSFLINLWEIGKKYETRSFEINPLVVTTDGKIMAADCRMTIDDYAVFRHPELGIRIAREFDHEPTNLDLIAYDVENGDYRGTFYFIQLEQDLTDKTGFVGFHGAGGGGSMMSMNALTSQELRPANFCDTSGNPPASKVYKAAKNNISSKRYLRILWKWFWSCISRTISLCKRSYKSFYRKMISLYLL